MEKLAHTILAQSEAVLMLVGFACLAIGFVLGLFVRRQAAWSLRRVPYLIWVGGLTIVIGFLPLLWLLSFAAVNAGILWVLTMGGFSPTALCGIGFAILAHARAINMGGTGRRAWWGIVPFLNLALFFLPPDDPVPSGGFANGFGVLLGLSLLVIG